LHERIQGLLLLLLLLNRKQEGSGSEDESCYRKPQRKSKRAPLLRLRGENGDQERSEEKKL
jgi:hypothetical protein